MNKKIAFVSTMRGYSWGGSEELWSQAALRLMARGIQAGISIFYSSGHGRLKEVSEKGGRFFPVMKPDLLSRVRLRIFKTRNWPLLDEFKPDLVVISQGGNSEGVSWMQACIQRKIRFVTMAHTAAMSRFWHTEEQAKAAASAYSHAEACYFVSQENLRNTRLQFAAALPQAKIIRNPFRAGYHEPLAWLNDSSVLQLACVGRLAIQDKGQDLLLEIMKENKWRERPLRISFFGEGPHEKILKEYARQHSINNVSFEGTADPLDIWKKHHALILPSRVEGMPITLVEAMLCGRPAIAAAAGGVPEILEDGISGFIAEAAEVKCLDQAMERAWQARESWEAMGKKAAENIRRHVPEDPAGIFADELMRILG